MVFSIRFDIARAERLARGNGWTNREWARRANVAERTLEQFLAEDPYMELSTIEDILAAVRLTAAELTITVITDAGAVSFRRSGR
jgi:hypothetical protein